MKRVPVLSLASVCLFWSAGTSGGAGFLDWLGLRKSTNASVVVTGLSEQQMMDGLKAALAKGIHQAVTNLGTDGGFLRDPKVRIPMPENLKRVEQTLRTLGQDKMADDFVSSLNRAAERAVPQAASVLGDSLKTMTVGSMGSHLLILHSGAKHRSKYRKNRFDPGQLGKSLLTRFLAAQDGFWRHFYSRTGGLIQPNSG